MAELKNDFSWSKSREETFRRCPRQYWFHYYGSWGGWDRRAPERTRTIYVLKQLESRQTWMGSTVHNCLRWVLNTWRQTGTPPAEEVTLAHLAKRLQSDYQNSGEGLYWDDPKKFTGLLEHEYDDRDVAEEIWRAVFEKAVACVSAFYHGEVFSHLQTVPRVDWLEIEDLQSFQLDGYKIWVQLDFAHRNGDGVVIYDWKTGRADATATREQLASYIFYAVEKWKAAPEHVLAREFNLAHQSLHESRLSLGELAATREAIKAAAMEMEKLHGAPEDHFPYTDNERDCAHCNFTRVCPKFQ